MVAGELAADGVSHAYPVVVLTVPRQSAKTSTLFAVALGRGQALADHRTAYMAQAGVTMVRKFRSDLFRPLEHSPLGPRWRVRRGAGDPGLEHRGNGSLVQGYPPRAGVLRSLPFDMVTVDEAQEHSAELGSALEATIMPTFQTRPRRQLWLVGTAPDDEHADGMFRQFYDRALAGTPGMCLIDYGIADDEDPFDPGVWVRRHPGLGQLPGTDVDFLQMMASQMTADHGAQFIREFCNRWPARSRGGLVIPADLWAAASGDPGPPPREGVWLGVDVTPDRRGGSVALAWQTGESGCSGGLLWTGSVSDLQSVVIEQAERLGARVIHDPVTTSSLARPNWRTVNGSEYASSCARFVDTLRAGTLTVRPDPALDAAADGVTTRPIGDAWAWARRRSAVDISPLVALTLACHGAARNSRPVLV